MQAVKAIGLDIAKSVFQVHGVDADGQVVIRRKLKRRYVLTFFEKLPARAWLVLRRPRHRIIGQAHPMPKRLLADRLSVGGIVLLPLDGGLDLGRRHRSAPILPSLALSRRSDVKA